MKQEKLQIGNIPAVLYGENDNLTERDVLNSFAEKYNCNVDIFEGGEHYFHTPEQLEYLADWTIKEI